MQGSKRSDLHTKLSAAISSIYQCPTKFNRREMSSVTYNRRIKKENFRKAVLHFEIVLIFRVSILLLVKIWRALPEEAFLRRGIKEDQFSEDSYLAKTLIIYSAAAICIISSHVCWFL